MVRATRLPGAEAHEALEGECEVVNHQLAHLCPAWTRLASRQSPTWTPVVVGVLESILALAEPLGPDLLQM